MVFGEAWFGLRVLRSALVGGALLATGIPGAWAQTATPTATGPQVAAGLPAVIAHRGASGYLPEETINAFDLAVKLGTDTIESDVQLTKDGVPVLLHDASLNATTNVVEYAGTHPDIFAAGTTVNGVRTYNLNALTYAQVKQLTATNRAAAGFGTGTTSYVPIAPSSVASLPDMLDYAYNLYRTTGKAVGIYTEAKAEGLALADAMLAAYNSPKYRGFFTSRPGAVVIESFYPATLQYLRGKTKIKLIQLASSCPNASDMAAIAGYADIVGPAVTTGTSAGAGAPSAAAVTAAANCAQLAHSAGLQYVPYTFYNDRNDYSSYYNAGLDGLFTNFPDIALSVRSQVFPAP